MLLEFATYDNETREDKTTFVEGVSFFEKTKKPDNLKGFLRYTVYGGIDWTQTKSVENVIYVRITTDDAKEVIHTWSIL